MKPAEYFVIACIVIGLAAALANALGFHLVIDFFEDGSFIVYWAAARIFDGCLPFAICNL